jgi:putative oxidoreductase
MKGLSLKLRGIYMSTIKTMWNFIFHGANEAPEATILLRIMAGSVFFWEGLLKFELANQGVGRFTKLGFPFPGLTADMVGTIEIIGGLFLMLGFLSRFVAIAFVIEMLVAMLSTKISMYLGTSPLPLPSVPPQTGLWAVLHEIRSEYAQLTCSAFILWMGPGAISLDAWLRRKS